MRSSCQFSSGGGSECAVIDPPREDPRYTPAFPIGSLWGGGAPPPPRGPTTSSSTGSSTVSPLPPIPPPPRFVGKVGNKYMAAEVGGWSKGPSRVLWEPKKKLQEGGGTADPPSAFRCRKPLSPPFIWGGGNACLPPLPSHRTLPAYRYCWDPAPTHILSLLPELNA